MKKLLCLVAVAVFSVSAATAQNYKWALGVRGGGEMSGLTARYNFNAVNAIEGILAINYDSGFAVTALYERNVPLDGRGWNFYYGGGAHVGSWSDDFVLGIDGIVGIEYKFNKVPLVLALDYKPMFDIAENTEFRLADVGLSIKIAF